MSTTTNDRTQELSKVPKVTALPEGCSVVIIDKSGKVLESIEAEKFFQAVRDSIQIGGRNLLTGTSTEWRSVTVTDSAHTSTLINLDKIGLKAGDSVILSMYIKPSEAGKKLRPRLEFYESDAKRCITKGDVVVSDDQICIVSVEEIPVGYSQLRWGMDANDTATEKIGNTTEYYRCPKLERGNIPTDWTPAPEDIIGGG